MDAHMVKRCLEIRDVGLDLAAQNLAQEEVEDEDGLLREGQHQGAEGGDVDLQGLSCHCHELLGQAHAHFPDLILALEDAVVCGIIGAQVGAHGVHQLVLGPEVIPAAVAEQDGSTSAAEEAVGHEHGAVVTEVPVLCDVLGGHHQGVLVGVQLQHLAGQINGDGGGAAAHAREVVADDVGAHLEVVDHHGTQGGGGVEEGAVDDQDANLLGLHTCLLQQVINGSEANHLKLLTCPLHCGAGGNGGDSRWQVGVLAQS
mmetsp:Transcript_5393/g.11879  ORF Transcript_5393/g.11879 Transcript_5393/m.11879 type:complete len:258 (-) Transcript_5393:671-1444(-)